MPRIKETDVDSSEPMMIVTALTLIGFDGDPNTPGIDYYAPADFDEAEHKRKNGIAPDSDFTDGHGQVIHIIGSSFTVERAQAEAMAKAGLVKITGVAP